MHNHQPRRRPSTARSLLAWAAAAALAASCAGCQDSAGPSTADEPNAQLQVFAAASLTEPFTEIGQRFEEQHSVQVKFNFAGSSDLAAQIQQGAPASVFASADQAQMSRVEDSEVLAHAPELFAANTLVIATAQDNPANIQSVEDMADDDAVVVVCAPEVPCGAATEQVTEAAGVELSPASEETAVTDVLGKVRSGEADAGLVYRTDAQFAGENVETIEIDGADEILNRYPIAALQEAPSPDSAEAFVEFVLSEQAQQILAESGFTTPFSTAP